MSRETDIFKKHHYNLCFQRAQTAERCAFECLAKYCVPIRSWGWSVADSCGSAPRDAHLLHRSCPELTQSCYQAPSKHSVEKCLRATSPSTLSSGTGWKLSFEMGLKQNSRKKGQVCLESSPCRSCSDVCSTPGKQNWRKLLLLEAGHISEELFSPSRVP